MTLKEILEQCKNLSIHEKRQTNETYNEFIFYAKDIDEWKKIFNYIFGSPIKPQGAKPTRDDIELTKDYGGVRDNQALFKKNFNGETIIVMFWPWGNGLHVTLKMALLKK